jgi:hypothetical protein
MSNDNFYQDAYMYHQPQPMMSNIMPGHNDVTLAEKRWESDDLEWNIAKILGMTMLRDEKGNVSIVPIPGMRPLMNQQGIHTVMMTIRTHVNPVLALSRTSDEEAKVMIRNACDDLMELLILNHQEYALLEQEINYVYGCLRNLLRAQILRARDGHESKNNKTQITEQHGQSVTETRSAGGFNLFPQRNKS